MLAHAFHKIHFSEGFCSVFNTTDAAFIISYIQRFLCHLLNSLCLACRAWFLISSFPTWLGLNGYHGPTLRQAYKQVYKALNGPATKTGKGRAH